MSDDPDGCGNCRFAKALWPMDEGKEYDGGMVNCRRYAPKIGYFPQVIVGDWCGEHERGTVAPRRAWE